MTRDEMYKRWIQRADTLRDRLADVGLEGLLASLAQVVRPLGPLAAQLLWMAQPALSTLEGTLSQEAGVLANLLDDPMALDHLLAQLTADTREIE